MTIKSKHVFSKKEAKTILRFIHLLYRYVFPNSKKGPSYLQAITGLSVLTQCNVFKLDWTGNEGEKSK